VEDINNLKDRMRQMMKQVLRQPISESWEKHNKAFYESIENATNDIATSILEEEKIEEIASYVRKGCTKIAYDNLVEKMIDDAILRAAPTIQASVDMMKLLMTEAAREAISELLNEKLREKGVK